ncbi:AAA family ATPase [Catenuloplanes indicus]|uniref:Orc1-like AAA ATPase domain-containing protein n=1 Tax=Catenuloplanes indicus TaxID=137267 RepID=A0AAE4B0Q5_9ACTN|nr:ATP-binding protein [Catenuloplanes indicus]MDQ0369829.1 hypothetical protein [Catenuloplanes indicus]
MTSPQDAALAAIRNMWAGRSDAERSAFASTLETHPPAADQHLQDEITRVRWRGALSGGVDPAALVTGLDPADAQRVLDTLVPEFDRSHVDEQWRWTMRSGPRRDALRTLADSPRALTDAITDTVRVPTDDAGYYLRLLAARSTGVGDLPADGLAARAATLPGRATEPGLTTVPAAGPGDTTEARASLPGAADAEGLAALDAARLLAAIAATGTPPPEQPVATRTALQALAWAEPLGGLAGDLAEARRRVRVEAVVDSYGALLGNGFFGRAEELARLRDFATGPVTGDGVPVPLLPVVGLGGVGKSTALAAFVEPYLREILRPDSTGPVVIVIDFDRVQFRIDAELELSFEVSRQLGNAHPVAAADFSALRYQVRQERAGTAAARYTGSLAAGEGAGDAPAFERDASLAVRLHELDTRPVLLVLDTFEEWQRDRPDPARPRLHDNDPEARILRWIARLRDTMGLHGLRVILSGRADVAINAADVTDRVETQAAICLADLAPAAAAELLEAHGVPAEQALELAVVVGGNPLTLRVAARFFAHLPPGERADFVASAGTALDGELRREVLYTRFLGHIADPRVRRLAHPGLILRRVTAGLIRDVLAPYCGLGPLTGADAAELLERLADEVWLVKRDGDELRHLPDVRRAMLHLMTTDPAYRDVLPAIHQAAAHWYRTRPGEEAAVEALYHELMLRVDDTARGLSERSPARRPPMSTGHGTTPGYGQPPARRGRPNGGSGAQPGAWPAPPRAGSEPKPRRRRGWLPVWPWRRRRMFDRGATLSPEARPADSPDLTDPDVPIRRPDGDPDVPIRRSDGDSGQDRDGDLLDPADRRLTGRLAALGDAVDELPPAVAAEARVLRGETPPLAEALLLRDSAWALWLERRGRFLVDNDAAAEALELLGARPGMPVTEPEWLAQACCDLARWDEYGPRASEFGGGRLTAHRYQTIAALLSGSVIALPAVDPETIGGGPGFHDHALIHYFYRLLLGRPVDIAAWRRREPLLIEAASDLTGGDRGATDLFPVDELRRALVWVAAGCPGGTITLRNAVPGIGTSLSRQQIVDAPEILRNLRGDNPELRAAVRTALAEAAAAEAAAGGGGAVDGHAGRGVAGRGVAGIPDADVLVRIDLAGDLGAYLDRAVAHHPGATLLPRVRDAFHRWARANDAVIDAIVRDAEAGRPDRA